MIQRRGSFETAVLEKIWCHTPHRKQEGKRKYLLIWELVLLKHAFCGQEREARSADLAANRIPQAGVLCSIGMDFAPQHGSDSTPAHRNGHFGSLWNGSYQLSTELSGGKLNFPMTVETFTKLGWEKGHICVVSSPFLVSEAQTVGEVVRLFWVWKPNKMLKCKHSYRKLLCLTELSLCINSGFSFAGAGASKIFNKETFFFQCSAIIVNKQI